VVTVQTLKREIVEVGRRVYARGYVAANDGNISARLDDRRVVITPTGVSKGFMSEEDMIVVDMDGKVVSGTKKPSSELFMHLNIYKHRADVRSVCHAHPPYATGFAVAGIPLEKCILPEVIIVLGGIPLVEYGTTGTEEFYAGVLRRIATNDAFLLANHGALTVGKDTFNAYYKMETLEHFAHITFVAQTLGQINTLNKEQVQKLTEIRERLGIQTGGECVTCEEEGTCQVPAPAPGPQMPDREALIRDVTKAIMDKLGSPR